MIPRSIVRTFQRFFKQIYIQTDFFAIYEFRVSRYITVASFQCFFLLIICPYIFQFLMKFFLILVLKYPTKTFMNYQQQEKAFFQIQNLSQQFYFDKFFYHSSEIKNQIYLFEYASRYKKYSLSIIVNWILDLTTVIFFFFLLIYSTPQIIIFKTFFTESLLSLSETTKCFLLIFVLDLLVGFHSSKSWEIFLKFFFENLGVSQTSSFIPFFISIFPVFLDTIFKYWIFRYLNKVSPSTVATYQAMIE